MRILSESIARKTRRAFTLPEVMVAMATSVLVIGGVMFSHITGLKMYALVNAKVGASDDTREMINRFVNEVRTAKIIKIGTATNSANFTVVADGLAQQGNAIQIFPTTNSKPFIQYYISTNQSKLIRSFNGTNSLTMADYVTNKMAFASEDFAGNVQTDNDNNTVVSLTLNFYQLQYATAKSGSPLLADTLQIQTRIARRTIY
ncbi:MAG: prepilin-type N-terminal cleavage/methylation domain-containing protein [Verrucomicrobiota bacterium]